MCEQRGATSDSEWSGICPGAVERAHQGTMHFALHETIGKDDAAHAKESGFINPE